MALSLSQGSWALWISPKRTRTGVALQVSDLAYSLHDIYATGADRLTPPTRSTLVYQALRSPRDPVPQGYEKYSIRKRKPYPANGELTPDRRWVLQTNITNYCIVDA